MNIYIYMDIALHRLSDDFTATHAHFAMQQQQQQNCDSFFFSTLFLLFLLTFFSKQMDSSFHLHMYKYASGWVDAIYVH